MPRLHVSRTYSEPVAGPEQVTASLYEGVVRDLEERLAAYGQSIARAADDLARSMTGVAPVDTVYFNAGLHERFNPVDRHIFQWGAACLDRSDVVVRLDAATAAAVRDPARLHTLVVAAVIDRNGARAHVARRTRSHAQSSAPSTVRSGCMARRRQLMTPSALCSAHPSGNHRLGVSSTPGLHRAPRTGAPGTCSWLSSH
jgi:hypothetical protein